MMSFASAGASVLKKHCQRPSCRAGVPHSFDRALAISWESPVRRSTDSQVVLHSELGDLWQHGKSEIGNNW